VGRLTTGKVSLNRRPLDLGDLVAGAMGAWRAAGRFSQHQVVLESASVWADIDETRIEQVIDNLVSNALKYTPRREVRDTGAGLPPELGERIFELFVQGERTPDRAQGGLGIGLTLVRALVALHGGTVSARSDGTGRGSVFTVRLPRVPAPAASSVASRPPAVNPTPRRILIVEDNDDAREMLRIQLTQEGHEVHEAADGPTGVDMAAAVAPEVVLVDVGLPGLDGYEVARRIRAGSGGRSILLIALTGYGQAEDQSRARDAGFSLHFTKPVPPERLHAAIVGAPVS
jgi:two-component system, sensor histidine kinase